MTTIYLDAADDALLRAETAGDRRPRPLGRSGHSDTSQRVNELLEDGFGR